MFSLVKDVQTKGPAHRDVFVHTLLDLMKDNPRVVCLEADLGGASNTLKIAKERPEQFIEVGIAEQNMIGIAAGMSSEGFIPFCHSFGPFVTRRCFDQIFLSGGYAHNPITVWGSDPGFTAGGNGGTHTTWEDAALIRMIPGSVIVDPADATQLEWIIREFVRLSSFAATTASAEKTNEPTAEKPSKSTSAIPDAASCMRYIRTTRKDTYNIYEPGSTFELGRGNILREGSDILVISAGQVLKDALDAARMLEDEGLSVEVIDMFCFKPLDRKLVISEAAGKKAVVTFENHSINGGLGSAVAETLAEAGIAVPFKRHGICEIFGQVGTPDWLQKEYKLRASDLVATVHALWK